MTHYLDIRLLPDPEFAPALLMGALYAKLHRVLVAQQRDDIGTSFPDYALAGRGENGKRQPATLGLCLRLHGSHAALAELMASDWLSGMRDHIAVSAVTAVPAGAAQLRVQRKQAKSSPARERDRLMRRQGLSAAEARQRIPDHTAEWLDLPYLTLYSYTTGRRFPLFIAQQPVAQVATGVFNSYGFSAIATVPAC